MAAVDAPPESMAPAAPPVPPLVADEVDPAADSTELPAARGPQPRGLPALRARQRDLARAEDKLQTCRTKILRGLDK